MNTNNRRTITIITREDKALASRPPHSIWVTIRGRPPLWRLMIAAQVLLFILRLIALPFLAVALIVREVWREHADYLIAIAWFLFCFILSLKVTGWF